ncbi:MAG: hypothetical protein M1812_004970 [Candelaria pacifica]|nr:MAG: hypothetical protein M1812_004970 [Candelaria pacifica]
MPRSTDAQVVKQATGVLGSMGSMYLVPKFANKGLGIRKENLRQKQSVEGRVDLSTTIIVTCCVSLRHYCWRAVDRALGKTKVSEVVDLFEVLKIRRRKKPDRGERKRLKEQEARSLQMEAWQRLKTQPREGAWGTEDEKDDEGDGHDIKELQSLSRRGEVMDHFPDEDYKDMALDKFCDSESWIGDLVSGQVDLGAGE